MERRASGGTQSFRREGAGGAGLAGCGCDRASGAEGCGGAKDSANIARILDAGKNHKKRSTGGDGCVEQLIECGSARVDKCGDALWMLGVGEALEEAVSSTQRGKSDFRPADQRSETIMMALSGFAEENRLDAATGAERFFDEADSFDADGAGFGGQTAAESHAELFEPAVVSAG
jgi:hypothetical protein